MATFPYTGFPDGTAYPAIGLGSTTVNVTSSSALTTALANAAAGQRILLANGTYSGSFTVSGKTGTSTAPISIEAATPGSAIFAAGSSITITNSAYVTVSGLAFTFDPTAPAIAFRGSSHHCRATRNLIGPTTAAASTSISSKILITDTCSYIRVDHNELRNLSSNGHGIEVLGNTAVAAPLGGCTYWRIDHNYLHDFSGGAGTDKAAIQCGTPTMSHTVSNGVVERNLCARILTGDRRVISGEVSNLRISGNVLAQCSGGIALLTGRSSVLSDNHIIDRASTTASSIPSAGIRFYDSGHEVSYNYVDGVLGGAREGVLLIDSGDQEGTSTVWDAHWRVVNALVERNVLVGNPEGVRFGHNYSLAPTGATVRDNLVAQAASGTAVTTLIAPISTTQTNNLYGATPGALGLAQGSDTVWRLANYGPRLTYLQPGDVGVSGDPSDSDGTGTLVGSNGGGGGPVVPVDDGTAAGKYGWGQPLAVSDEFEYTGAPNSSIWNVYNSAGHDGNGVRSPSRVTVAGGKMVLTGLAGSANTAGLEHKLNQTYGRWEVRARSFYTSSPTTPGTLNGGYHPVLIVWPDDSAPVGGGGSSVPVGQTTKMTESWTGSSFSSTLWSSVQTHSYDGSASGYSLSGADYRLQVVNDSAAHTSVLRTEVRDGDTAVGSHERSEISSFGKGWNDNQNEECWYEFDIKLGDPSWSPSWSSSDDWLIIFQWHHVGSSDDAPPLALSVHSDNKVYFEREANDVIQSFLPVWTVRPGVWEHVVIHVKWSPSSSTGFVEAFVNDVQTVPKTFCATQHSDDTQGYYVKMGQYRRSSVSGTTVVKHDNIRVSTTPATTGGTGGGTGNTWPYGGEYDFLENGEPGMQAAESFLHYPSIDGVDHQVAVTPFTVDLRQFHNFAFEWSPTGLSGWVDGTPWFTHSGGAASDRKALQAMTSGHLTVQLDAFQATGCIASTMELEWARIYTLTPVGNPSNPQTVSAVGIASREAFGVPSVTTPGAPPPVNSIPSLLGQFILGTTPLGFSTGTTPPDPAGSQTVRPAGIPSGQAFGIATFSVPDGDQFITATGIPPVTAFGRPTINGGAAPAPAPGGVLVPALFAVGADGITLTPLPAWVKMHLSPVRNSAGSLSIDYPAGAPGFDLLNTSVSANPLKALEIRVWLGGNNTAALGGWLVQKSGDSLTPGAIWTFSGHFHEWLLSKAIVAPQQISEANKSGALTFAGATAGLILATTMDQAQARGALPLVVRDFTTTHDSAGQPWSKAISSVKFAPKTTITQIADKLVELGMVEYGMSAYRLFQAFNPEGRGVDRSTGTSPVQFAQTLNLKERAQRESSRDAGTAVLVAGSEGFYSFASSPTAQAQLGWRAEVGVDAGQLNSQTAVDAVSQSYLQTANSGTAEYSAAIVVGPGHKLPLIDYGVGDWALVRVGTRYERQRIAQIELDFEPGTPPSGSVEFNDLITDKLTALYKRLNAISTGDAVVGTSESTPGGAGEDHMPPAAPRGLTVVSIDAYQQPGESETYALVSAGWEAVTTNAYPDQATADKAATAATIGARLEVGQTVSATWTWSGMSATEAANAPLLIEEWKTAPANDGSTGNETSIAARDWLLDYASTHQGGGAITDDVERYRVQWRFLGSQVVPSRQDPGNGVPGEPQPPRDPNAFPDNAAWFEPGESPTTATRVEFGGVLAGRAITVRVSAVDRAGNQGPWCTPVSIVTAIDNQPPPAPSKPVATAWFRTMDITWDGKGSSGEDMFAAAPDVAGGGLVEVHVDTGIDFTPDRPLGANGKVDLALSRTYRAALYDAGTWNETNLVIGTTYYARLVAVDKSGNASEPSETSDGVLPQQLVNIDIGPNAIARAQIIDGEIVRAKIADLAVNDAKIETVSVGKLTAGTITAQMTLSGRFSTPVSATGHQVQFDSAGLRMYRGGTVIGRWETFDGSMLITGQTQTAVTGQRIVMNPGGGNPDTIRFYPTSTDVYSSIDSVSYAGGTIAGIQVVGSGTTALSNRGMLVIRDQNASLVHGRTDLSYWGSEIWVEQNFTRNKSATVDLIVDERLTPLSGPRRVAMITYNAAGQPRNPTGLYYGVTGAFGGEPMLYANGQDVNLVFGGTDGVTSSRLLVRNNANTQFREIAASAFTQSSSRTEKYGIRELDIDPIQQLRAFSPKHFRRHGDLESDAERLGFIAEDMPDAVRQRVTVQNDDGPPTVIETIDPVAVTALIWAAAKGLDQRLSALEEGAS